MDCLISISSSSSGGHSRCCEGRHPQRWGEEYTSRLKGIVRAIEAASMVNRVETLGDAVGINCEEVAKCAWILIRPCSLCCFAPNNFWIHSELVNSLLCHCGREMHSSLPIKNRRGSPRWTCATAALLLYSANIIPTRIPERVYWLLAEVEV